MSNPRQIRARLVRLECKREAHEEDRRSAIWRMSEAEVFERLLELAAADDECRGLAFEHIEREGLSAEQRRLLQRLATGEPVRALRLLATELLALVDRDGAPNPEAC